MTTLRMSCERVDSNPNMTDAKWAATAAHWRCKLSYGRRSMVVYFSQGSAWGEEEPTLRNLMGALVSDSQSIENASNFEDWAGNYGMDADSRKAEASYRHCVKQSYAFRRLLGNDYDTVCAEYQDA